LILRVIERFSIRDGGAACKSTLLKRLGGKTRRGIGAARRGKSRRFFENPRFFLENRLRKRYIK
jgi:hypothetical protein